MEKISLRNWSQLQELTKASNAKVEYTEHDSKHDRIDAIVTFDDAPVVKDVISKIMDFQSIYSVDISPSIETVSIIIMASKPKSIITIFINYNYES